MVWRKDVALGGKNFTKIIPSLVLSSVAGGRDEALSTRRITIIHKENYFLR